MDTPSPICFLRGPSDAARPLRQALHKSPNARHMSGHPLFSPRFLCVEIWNRPDLHTTCVNGLLITAIPLIGWHAWDIRYVYVGLYFTRERSNMASDSIAHLYFYYSILSLFLSSSLLLSLCRYFYHIFILIFLRLSVGSTSSFHLINIAKHMRKESRGEYNGSQRRTHINLPLV